MPGSPATGRPFSGPPIAWAPVRFHLAKATADKEAGLHSITSRTQTLRAVACRMRPILPSGMAARVLFTLSLLPCRAPLPASAKRRRRTPDIHFKPTRHAIADAMLQLAGVTAQDVVYDLGSGDGRIPIIAAQKYGARGVGIEIDPRLVDAVVGQRQRRAKSPTASSSSSAICSTADLSEATVVTMYLSPSIMKRLIPTLRALKPGTRIVSHQFDHAGLAARRAPPGGRSRNPVVESSEMTTAARTLEIRGTLETDFADVLTPAAIAALEHLAPFDRDRKTLMDARIERRRERAESRQRIGFLDPDAVIGRTDTHRPRCARRQVHRQRDSGRPAPPVDPGHRSGRPAQRAGRGQHSQRRLRAAVGRRRLDVRRRRRARPGLDDVAREPAQPEAGHPRRSGVPAGGRTGGRRDEPVGGGSSSSGRSSTTGAGNCASPRRSSAPAACTSTTARSVTPSGEGFSASIVDATLYVVNNHQRLRELGASLVLYLPKIQTAEEAALWNDILSALEDHLGLAAGHRSRPTSWSSRSRRVSS